MALTICNSISRNCSRLMRDWKLENLRNGKEGCLPFTWGNRLVDVLCKWKAKFLVGNFRLG